MDQFEQTQATCGVLQTSCFSFFKWLQSDSTGFPSDSPDLLEAWTCCKDFTDATESMSNQCYHISALLSSTGNWKETALFTYSVLFFKSQPLKIETINIIRINGSFQLSVSHIPKFHLQDFLEIRLYKNIQNLKCSVLSKVKADCREFRAMVKYWRLNQKS